MTPHSATVELRPDGRVFVQVYSQPQGQTWIVDGLPTVLSDGDDPEALGEAVIAALGRSTVDVLPARDLRANPPSSDLLAWAGARSWAAYTRGVRSVDIDARYDSELTTVDITPEARERTGATVPVMEHRRLGVMVESPAQLGREIQAALAFATA